MVASLYHSLHEWLHSNWQNYPSKKLRGRQYHRSSVLNIHIDLSLLFMLDYDFSGHEDFVPARSGHLYSSPLLQMEHASWRTQNFVDKRHKRLTVVRYI